MQGRTPSRDHLGHDLLLIAASADRDADPATRAAADRQSASCSECARLQEDLRSIAAGLQALPRTANAPRDFRITQEQAARLQRGSGWRRLLAPFGNAALPSLRLVASACTSLGLAGLFVTVLLPGLVGFGGSAGAALSTVGSSVGAPSEEQSTSKDTGSTAPAAAAGAPSPAPGLVSSPVPAAPGSATAAPAPGGDYATPTEAARGGVFDSSTEDPNGPSRWPLPVVVSIAFLAVGIGLFGLRLVVQRLL